MIHTHIDSKDAHRIVYVLSSCDLLNDPESMSWCFIIKPESWSLYVAEDKKGGLTHNEMGFFFAFVAFILYFFTNRKDLSRFVYYSILLLFFSIYCIVLLFHECTKTWHH